MDPDTDITGTNLEYEIPSDETQYEAIISPVVVLEHCLDEAQGTYRLVIGRRIYVPATDTMEEIHLGITDDSDYVFDADDRRWFNEDGTRRPDEDVAAEQKDDVREARRQVEEAAQQAGEARALPGVGEEF